jgi:diguanylate cyclase (GGDEF)-like protein
MMPFDLDHFKSINDRFRAAGDRRCASSRRSREARSGERTFRPDRRREFAAFCRTAIRLAERIADRIRGDLAAKAIVHGGMQVTATVSVGVASMVPGADLETLMAWADEALYASKRGGRDRVSGSLAATG